MNETTTAPNPESASKEPTNKASKDQSGHIKASPESKKTVYRLLEHIDENGRYADALKPVALGYAAGKGISEYEAKQDIDTHFKKEIGVDMKGYLAQHRKDRGLDNSPSRA